MNVSDLKTRTDESSRKLIYSTVLVAAMLPEYIAPLLTLIFFIIFKRRYSLTGQKVKLGTVGKVFLCFMCFSLLSAVWSLTPVYSAAISLLWMGMLLGSFMLSNLTVDKKQLQTLICAFSLGGGMVGGVGTVQYILLLLKVNIPNPIWSVFDKLIYSVMPFEITETAYVWEHTRASSTFDNPLICATYLIIVLPIAVYGFISGEKRNRKICGISALLIIGGLLGTTSRGAAIAALVSLVVLVFMNSKKALSVLAALAASAGGFILVIIKRNDVFEFDLEKSTDSRLKMWAACAELIKKKPLLGYGAGSQSTALGMADFGIDKPHAHSLYIEMTTELGFVGMAFLLVVFGFIIYDIIKLIKCGKYYKRLGIAFLAVCAGFAVSSFTEFTMQTPKELQYFMFFLGILEAAKRIALAERAETAQKPETEPEHNTESKTEVTV